MGKQANLKKTRKQEKLVPNQASSIFYCKKHQTLKNNLEFLIQSDYISFGGLACHNAVKHHFLPPEEGGIGTRSVFIPTNKSLCVWPHISPEAETAIGELIASPDYSLRRIMTNLELIITHPFLLTIPIAKKSWDYPYKTVHWSPVTILVHTPKFKLLNCPLCQHENL